MGDPLDGLTGAQREAVTSRADALLIVGAPGAGKTEALARRLCWLSLELELAPHLPLVVARDAHGCAALGQRIEELLDAPHEDLSLYTVPELAARLVAEQAAAAGIEELTPLVTAAERLALLLTRIDALDLREHDFRGRPLALLAAVVRRIDRLKSELIDCERYAEIAAGAGQREREFALLYRVHEDLLREHGVIDRGGQLIACVRMLEREPDLAGSLARRHGQLLIDDWGSRPPGERELLVRLAAAGAPVTVTGDDREQGGVLELVEHYGDAAVVHLTESLRCPQAVLDAAAAASGGGAARGRDTGPRPVVGFWRCASARAQAQHAAAELERLTRAEGVDPARCAVIVRSVAGDGPGVAEALSERGISHGLLGAGAFFERTEVRDVLAWLRLLVDPRDAAAIVRALSRPPIELHAVDVARCVQLARRRKLDVVAALEPALASPALPPEARERVAAFLELQRASAAALDEERSDLFVHRLIERLGLRRRQLFSAEPDVVERLLNLARLEELAARHVRALPSSTPREFAAYAAAVAESGIGELEVAVASASPRVVVAAAADVAGREFDHVFVLTGGEIDAAGERALASAMTRARETLVVSFAPAGARSGAGGTGPPTAPAALERARAALSADWEEHCEELFGPAATLHALFGERRDELLDAVARVGARLGELRFDTDLDVTHVVVRLLELVKLAALLERRAEQPLAEALADINARLAAAATPLEREILLSSPLDELLAGEQAGRARPPASEEPSLAAFLPRRGDGLVLSASDVETYRACPLRYKFARVLRIPREPTLNQRFGIVVHQVLERYHQQAGASNGDATILPLLEVAWRRGGLGDTGEERQLHEKARGALLRYQERLAGTGGVERATAGMPRWFERSFSFRLGPHLLRGRVDRIDELPSGGYQLIDYKTGLPRRAEQLREDVQLALYSLAAHEAWQLEATERTYYYVLDDERVSLGADESGDWIADTVKSAADGILAQAFAPTPSRAVCSLCDYRIACPVAER